MKHANGERLNIRFSKKIKLEFHGARLTSAIHQKTGQSPKEGDNC